MLKVLYGAEPYLVNEKVREITKDIDDMNVAHFDELTSAVFQTAQQYPFLASRQAIVVDIDKLGACEELLSAKIPEFTDFIVCPKVVDERTKVFKALKKAGCVDECKKMDLQSLKKAIREKVSERGCSISDEMIENFVQHIGYFVDENVSLYTINIALKQLCFGTVEISMDDIVALVPRSVNVKMWELSTVLMDLDAKKLYQMAEHLLDEKESGIGMLSLLLRSFRLAYKATLCKRMNLRENEIAKKLGVPAYQYKSAMRFSPEQISKALDLLQGGVNRIKSGIPERVVFPQTLAEVLVELGGVA